MPDELQTWMSEHVCVDDINDYSSEGDLFGELIYECDGKLYVIYYNAYSQSLREYVYSQQYVPGKGFSGGTPIYEVIRKTRTEVYYELAEKSENHRPRSMTSEAEDLEAVLEEF